MQSATQSWATITSPALPVQLAVLPPQITISVVSHAQGRLVGQFLDDVRTYCAGRLEVIVTVNIAETLPFAASDYPFPVRVVENDVVRGFAANHNRAFRMAAGDYFVVANPDLRLTHDPLPALIKVLDDRDVGVVGPLVVNSSGDLEASARRFPTPTSIVRKVLAWRPLHDYAQPTAQFEPDWIAGTFMVFRTSTFTRLGGFDEQYFMYYEDVDVCARIRTSGLRVSLEPHAVVVHDPGRRSWSNPYYTLVHLRSMMRYFCSGIGPKKTRALLEQERETREHSTS